MKEPHLLRVEADQGGPERFGALFRAAAAAGLRIGWLELEEPSPLPPGLETAAGLGALRAVAVGPGKSVAVKPRKGAPVLRDLLREHFLGCALVLVRGTLAENAENEAPELLVEGDRWKVGAAAFDTEGLVAALRKPRPW